MKKLFLLLLLIGVAASLSADGFVKVGSNVTVPLGVGLYAGAELSHSFDLGGGWSIPLAGGIGATFDPMLTSLGGNAYGKVGYAFDGELIDHSVTAKSNLGYGFDGNPVVLLTELDGNFTIGKALTLSVSPGVDWTMTGGVSTFAFAANIEGKYSF